MDTNREPLRQQLMDKFREKLDETLLTPTMTLTDIENVVMELQKGMSKEVAEGLLRQKKTPKEVD